MPQLRIRGFLVLPHHPGCTESDSSKKAAPACNDGVVPSQLCGSAVIFARRPAGVDGQPARRQYSFILCCAVRIRDGRVYWGAAVVRFADAMFSASPE